MNTRELIESWGFFPAVVDRAIRRALGGAEPVAMMHQLEAAFDQGQVFRHLTVLAAGANSLVHLHVDEAEVRGATVASAVYRLSALKGLSVVQTILSPETGGEYVDLSVTLNLSGIQRTEIEHATCGDENCEADHGYVGMMYPDDVSLRISEAADGREALECAQDFIDYLTAQLAEQR